MDKLQRKLIKYFFVALTIAVSTSIIADYVAIEGSDAAFLAGVTEVEIIIENTLDEECNVSDSDIYDAAEIQLRRNNFKVSSDADPFVYINVNGFTINDSRCVANMEFEVSMPAISQIPFSSGDTTFSMVHHSLGGSMTSRSTSEMKSRVVEETMERMDSLYLDVQRSRDILAPMIESGELDSY